MTQPINTLPAIALRETILPEMIVHFDISRERSIKAVEAAMLRRQEIFLVTKIGNRESRNFRSVQSGHHCIYQTG